MPFLRSQAEQTKAFIKYPSFCSQAKTQQMLNLSKTKEY